MKSNTQYIRRKKLKEFREKLKLSQQEMADKLNLSLIQYQFIELGRRNPSYNVLLNFKACFPKESVEDIFLIKNFT